MTTESDWAPEDCTLPTAERPLRTAAFADLFATAGRGVQRPAPTRLRVMLDAAARRETQRLAAAETACCSFFTFTIGEPAAGLIAVDIDVPAERADILDALAMQAEAASTRP